MSELSKCATNKCQNGDKSGKPAILQAAVYAIDGLDR